LGDSTQAMAAGAARLVRLQPQQFRRRQARHEAELPVTPRIRGVVARQGGRLGIGARIVPQDGGTDHVIAGVEQHGAVHLAGQADAGDLLIFLRPAGAQLCPGPEAGAPPVVRCLFGPARCGRLVSMRTDAWPRTVPWSISTVFSSEVPRSIPRKWLDACDSQ
jgi:hypothetical protein